MGCHYDKAGKSILITPRLKAWCQVVNEPGFVPKRVDHSIRYKILDDGSLERIPKAE